MHRPPQENRRAAKGGLVNGEESRRADAQRHLDGRRARLEAYATSLEDALSGHPSAERSARLQEQLAQVRKDIRLASRSRVPGPRGLPTPAPTTPAPDAPGEAEDRPEPPAEGQ